MLNVKKTLAKILDALPVVAGTKAFFTAITIPALTASRVYGFIPFGFETINTNYSVSFSSAEMPGSIGSVTPLAVTNKEKTGFWVDVQVSNAFTANSAYLFSATITISF